MKVKTALLMATLLFGTAACASVPPQTVDEVKSKFALNFKNVPVDDVKIAEIPGLFEIYTGGKIIYYSPDKDLLMFGEIYTLGGVSLTAEKTQRIVADKSKSIDRSKGLVVGDGPTELVAFVSADCGYCAQAQHWLESLDFKNTKEVLFFLPMEKNSPAYARAMAAVCAPPELRREALRQTFMPGFKANPLAVSCPEGEAMLEAQAKIAVEAGVTATPVFIVKDQTVLGFRQDQLASLLSVPEVSN